MALERILVVDDEEQIRRLLGRMLERNGWQCTLAADAAEARRRLAEDPYALLVCDVQMPGESGLDLVRDVLVEHPDVAALMVTGVEDPEVAEVALNSGAYGYLLKPFQHNQVLISVSNALHRRKLEIENRPHREKLEQTVEERTAALRGAMTRLEGAAEMLRVSHEEAINRLSRALEYRDEETGGHVERMSQYCGLLARGAGIEPYSLIVASPMHDVGKIAIPDSILLKPGKLTDDERRKMEEHAELGRTLLSGSGSELLELAASVAGTHHEKFDGTGYPDGLSGEEIPLEGRIAAVADVFDALTTDRVYRPAFPLEKALEIIRDDRGKHFDPEVVDVFLGSLDEVVAIQEGDAVPAEQVGA